MYSCSLQNTLLLDLIAVHVGAYPSFTINTDNFEPGQHTLVLVLRAGTILLQVRVYTYP